ncbi:hypothetical protein [Serratia inhibens]|uniref:hypothetical protein n=1 Tax=Serratia inhibens TaxID=2338073 RepID=UPI0008094B0E|nr:hypothetical protein [Serratia inhibens]ANS42508.1 hypothetical protein Q5A_010240 [Serratia inhibens PRI-2C]
MKRTAVILLIGMVFFSVNVFAAESEISSEVKDDIADILTAQYNNIAKDCGDEQSPAFLCSGVLMRGTRPGVDFWRLNPSSIKNNGVSFSYLRKDAKFNTTIASANGFILFPGKMTPAENEQVSVLCSYALDANTWGRQGNYCGSPPSPEKGQSCQDFGVFTAHQLNKAIAGRSAWGVCAFDVRPTAKKPADAFYQTLLAMPYLGNGLNYNEIMVKPWDENNPKGIPIEALFYLNGGGLVYAQQDQRSYKNTTGKFLPIVKIELPKGVSVQQSTDAVFSYEPKDQVVEK